MELRPGYTMTELGVLPEDWEVRPLGELGILIKGKGITRSEALSGVLPCIRYGEIYTHHNFVVKDFISFISRDVAEKSMRLECGDILFTCSGETKEDIGKCVSFIFSIEAYAGGDIIILRNASEDAVFLGYRLNAFDIVQQKSSLGQGDAVVHISQKALSSILVSFPKALPEQHAIAAALSDVDALLDAQERLIAKKRNIKLAAMQQLLTGKTRLPGFQEPWIKKFFGEIFEFLPTNSYSRSQFVQRGCIRNIHYGDILTKFSFIIDISKDKLPFINKILSEKNYPQKCFLQNGDVVIANTAEDFTVGKAVEVINIDGKVLSGQHTFLCRPKIRFAKGLLGYLINSEKFHGQLAAYVTGIKVSSISKTSLSGLFLEFPPSLDEQRAIAAVLSDMDAELTALEARRDKLRAVKQGMMRELLTGRTRLAGAGGQHGR